MTTPAYNTAVVAVNRGAFPYGGLELARLFDGQQDVAGGVGGRPPASFGVVVRDGAGKIVLASQRAVTESEPLKVLEPTLTRAPYAGPFSRLRVAGIRAVRRDDRSRRPTRSRPPTSRPSGG